MLSRSAALLTAIRPFPRPLFVSISTVLMLMLIAAYPLSTEWLRLSGPESASLEDTIDDAVGPFAFSLTEWEVGALLRGGAERMRSALLLTNIGDEGRSRLLMTYYDSVGQANELRRQRDDLAARASTERETARLRHIEQRLAAAEDTIGQQSALASYIIAKQVEHFLVQQGLRKGPLVAEVKVAFPPVTLQLTPPVFFQYSRLPLLLVVAPRDRIAVTATTLLQPTMAYAEMARVEAQIDATDVSSVVLPIGGFAAYPSMIPRDQSLRQSLQTIAHEWVHHYLAVRPLGLSYFSDYTMRTINETVADLAGKEVGDAVVREHYADLLPAIATAVRTTPGGERFDFGRAMAEIRTSVEAMLKQGDVAGAETYMSERKRWLEDKGYHLRKLNTAYLTFYGAYAGSGNPYEESLRRIRAGSKSVVDFLERASTIGSERNLFDMATQAQGGE